MMVVVAGVSVVSVRVLPVPDSVMEVPLVSVGSVRVLPDGVVAVVRVSGVSVPVLPGGVLVVAPHVGRFCPRWHGGGDLRVGRFVRVRLAARW